MREIELYNDYCSEPANTVSQIIEHPSGDKNRCLEIALFNEHRFAFYFWIKWINANKLSRVPDLITFDWHQDLAYPCESEMDELKNLDLNKLGDVAYYSWARLNPLNDNHILSAAYLSQLNNIWVVCKQSDFDDWDDEEIIDLNGVKHIIRKFKNHVELLLALQNESINDIFFDIDLDYFTIENSTKNDKHKFTYMSKNEIKNIFSPENEFMCWILNRMCGFTIALEPEHTGGLIESLKILKIINELFFDKSLSNWNCSWKHLK